MKFERLNSDKIRITLNIQDLKNNNIDFNSFMSNSDEAQDLFLNILDLAQEKTGFSTENCKISVETLYLNNGCFILNITRFKNNSNNKPSRVVTKKKGSVSEKAVSYLYSFSALDYFLDFYLEIKKLVEPQIFNNLKYSLYLKNNEYYVLFDFSKFNHDTKKLFLYILSEYGFFKTGNHYFLENAKCIKKDLG